MKDHNNHLADIITVVLAVVIIVLVYVLVYVPAVNWMLLP